MDSVTTANVFNEYFSFGQFGEKYKTREID